ncbi:MAG: AAA family ATPase [Candidatus Omnitrophica bacterium]|nr:AAA family ATPase [Candidatus Omnitrophota bacterium]
MQQYELNIRDYIRIFQKRKFTVIVTFVVVLAATFFNISRQPYVYEASSTVKIEERKSIAGLLTEWIVYNPQDVMESETMLIKGFPVMEQVAKRLGLVTDKTPLVEARGIIEGIQHSISTSKIENTNIIEIKSRGGDPKEVMDLANVVSQVYVEQNLAEKTQQARAARQFIEDQLSALEERLKKAELQLRGYGDRAADLRLAEPTQDKIVELQFEKTALMQKYTEKHPRIIQITQQIKDLGSQTKNFSGDEIEYGRLIREVDVNKKLYGMLKEKLEEARITEAQKVSDASIVDPAVFPTEPVEPNKRMGMLMGALLGLIMGIALAFLFETVDPSIGTIEDVENVIKLHVLGVVPSVHGEIEPEKRPDWFSFFVRPSPLQAKEKQKEIDRYVRLFVHYKPTSLVAEAFRTIQANLKISAEGPKVFLVTSSGPGEGKTTALINLGLTCAQSGFKTLLVSSDLRRPTIARAFGLKREFGLREYLEGTLDLDGIVKNVSDMVLGEMGYEEILKFPGIENISIIPSGDIPDNPAALLDSGHLKKLVADAKKNYDLVLFDSPPILPIADATILAPLMDSVIIVYEIGKTARQALMRAKLQLESTGAKLSGVILNNIKPRTESIMFSYPYYYKYKYREEAKKNVKEKPRVD